MYTHSARFVDFSIIIMMKCFWDIFFAIPLPWQMFKETTTRKKENKTKRNETLLLILRMGLILRQLWKYNDDDVSLIHSSAHSYLSRQFTMLLKRFCTIRFTKTHSLIEFVLLVMIEIKLVSFFMHTFSLLWIRVSHSFYVCVCVYLLICFFKKRTDVLHTTYEYCTNYP